MKISILPALTLLSFPISITAAPIQPWHHLLSKRQEWTGMWSQEFSYVGCKPIIFIWARETIAPGNMGVTIGPSLSNGLKAYFGVQNVATQGVNYKGLMETNYYAGGSEPLGIWEMQQLLTQAASYCPQSRIVAAGYRCVLPFLFQQSKNACVCLLFSIRIGEGEPFTSKKKKKMEST